ncbi:MAG: ATP-binding protein [Aliivibrio sp.]|uniref:ATP-dependent nuclease n=1 Tax=Aliivibrio sp. TaxID=1872443 RepID=UPI001A58513C|nr:ATP-binding protein [Aliivibrio sp.]
MKVAHISIRNFRGIKSLSWRVRGDFNCIIGPGDTCKTTILAALDYALSPRSPMSFDDSDFYNLDVEQDIVIQVTLSDWDEARPEIRRFFSESKFAQYKCGLTDDGPIPEPEEGGPVAVSVSLRVDESLEPKWSVVRGVDEREDQDRKPVWAADRAALGVSRVDSYTDFHLTWGHNSLLTRLSSDNENSPNAVLSELAREMRQSDISAHKSVAECQKVANTVKAEALKSGVKLSTISPKIDLRKRSVTAGALSLHEGNVPLRNKGAGSKKLIATAMQMKLNDGKSVALVDELEVGLEPHRIRGLIHRLRASKQQIFVTTHSPVVIRELNVSDNELFKSNRDSDGNVSLANLIDVPNIQGPLRGNAEAFLGGKIVACEGLTEMGCLRAYDFYRFKEDVSPVWSLATSYFNCGGAGKIKSVCPKLEELGYNTAVLCDNDALDQLSLQDVEDLRAKGIHVCQWDTDKSTEDQLFHDLPWENVPTVLTAICKNHDKLELASLIDVVRKDPAVEAEDLAIDPATWPESPALRETIGRQVKDHDWIKRIDYSSRIFHLAFPLLPEDSVFMSRLDALWNWIQHE